MFYKDNQTTKQSIRPYSQSRRRNQQLSKKIFIPFKQERDSLGRLLKSLKSNLLISQDPESSTSKMKEYLTNTISLDKDIKYQGFVVNGPKNIKPRSQSTCKKLLVKNKKQQIIPFYDCSKEYIMKRPKSAIILSKSQTCSIPRPPSQYKNIDKPKKKIYSFKFSYPKSIQTYRQTPVSDQQIFKMQQYTNPQNRKKRIRKQMPVLMYVQNVKISSTPQQMFQRWNNLNSTKQKIISKLTRLQS